MADVIAVLILAAWIGGAAVYLIRAKRKGVKCIGCPAAGKNGCASGMHCPHCAGSMKKDSGRLS